MNAIGELAVLTAALILAVRFWMASRSMGRAHEGTRRISLGLGGVAVAAALDNSDRIGLDRLVNGALVEGLAYGLYAASAMVLLSGFMRWLPLIKRLDGEVAGRARAEAEHHKALERSRRFNAGLEDLGKTHIEEGWTRGRLRDETARRLSELIGCDRVSVWRFEQDGDALACLALYEVGADAATSGAVIERETNPAYFKAVESGGVVCVSDAINDPATSAFGPGYLEPLNIGALLDAPIRTGRGVSGVVCCEHVGGPRVWTPEEVAVVSAAAQYIAVAYLADSAETLAADLKLALRAAEAASTAKTAFLANMSHEIRTPLNGVLGMAQALSNQALAPDHAAKVDTIISSSQLLLGVLNDVLDLSKIEAGRLDIRPEPVDPAGLIRQTCDLFRPAAGQKGLELSCDIRALPDLVALDPVRVRQVVGNLIANAVKFTDAGAISVEARAEGDAHGDWRLSITVADTGCGIDPDLQPRLFRRFSQADEGYARRQGGAGLGLVIARELAGRMGGDITVSSTPGLGSCFTATFTASAAESRTLAPAAGAAADLSTLSGVRVLLVDDNEVNRIVARCFLEPSGVTVVEASSGAEAVDLFGEQMFNLVLLDAHMPGMDGLSTLNALRLLPRGAQTPVIALTADAMAGDEARYRSAGMDGYVPKPVDKARLLEACADLAATGRAALPADRIKRA